MSADSFQSSVEWCRAVRRSDVAQAAVASLTDLERLELLARICVLTPDTVIQAYETQTRP